MGMVIGLVALAVWGSDPVPPSVETGSEVTCEVRMMTVEGLDWRSVAYSRMKPAARQGSATIWTADRSLKAALEASSDGKSIQAPKVTMCNDQTGTINSDKFQKYISHVDRVSDGPINEASQLAFRPELGTIREGFSASFAGHRYDQGVMAKVKISESHVLALYTLILQEETKPTPTPLSASITPTEVGRQIVQAILCPKPSKMGVTVQVPEVFTSNVQGEWFVPNDSILLISLGVNTVADSEGKAKVQERLAILDFARPCDESCTVQANLTPNCQVEPIALTASKPMNMPAVPDRSFPEAMDQDGNVIELPPLPEAYASANLDQIKPGSALASAQSSPGPKMMTDPQLARTSLQAIPDSELEDSNSLLQTYYSQLSEVAKCDAELARSSAAVGLTRIDARVRPLESDGLASIVEGFLRQGMKSSMAENTCDEASCPAEGCPFSAEGCDEGKTSPQAANIEIGISVRDGKGLCVFNAEEDLVSALKNPGKAEVKYIPLGGKVSLEIQAKVVPTPTPEPAQPTQANQTAPIHR